MKKTWKNRMFAVLCAMMLLVAALMSGCSSNNAANISDEEVPLAAAPTEVAEKIDSLFGWLDSALITSAMLN